ncbi:hypothetical protein T439DRAFT_30245 [Meredithblackwellia eburnea MCA 4105]
MERSSSPTPQTQPPRKKKKSSMGESDEPVTLVATFSALVSLLSDVQPLVKEISSRTSSDFSPLQDQLPKVLERVEKLEKAITKARKGRGASSEGNDPESLPTTWSLDLDREGVALWNESVSIKRIPVVEESLVEEGGNRLETVVAGLRVIGFKLIALGSPDTLDEQAHASLLSTATKAAVASTIVNDFRTAENLFSAAASHAEALAGSPDGADASLSKATVRILLQYYAGRIKFCFDTGNLGVVSWLKSRLMRLCEGATLDPPESELVFKTTFEAGSSLLHSLRSEIPGEDSAVPQISNAANAAVSWLVWASALVEREDENSGNVPKKNSDRLIQVWEKLAEAYLFLSHPEAGSQQAESTIREILARRPTAKWWSVYLKLLVDRKAGDKELIEGFRRAANEVRWSEELSIRVANPFAIIHTLPEERLHIRLSILSAMAEGISSLESHNENGRDRDQAKDTAFAVQIVTAASSWVTDQNRVGFDALLDTLAEGCYHIEPHGCFVVITNIWRKGDLAHREGNFSEAAGWYGLGAHPLLATSKGELGAKSRRKAALCFSENGDYDKAEAIFRDTELASLPAKSQFVRFHNFLLQKDEVRALAALDLLAAAPDATVSILLWTATTSLESGMKSLSMRCLQKILELCKSYPRGTMDGVDTLVLIRSLVRLTLSHVDEHHLSVKEGVTKLIELLSSELVKAQAVAASSEASSSLLKSLAWLHKTGYNTCIRLGSELEAAMLVTLYDEIANLMELECQLCPRADLETLSKLYLCRFASLTGRLTPLREIQNGPSKIEAYRSFVEPVATLRSSFEARLMDYPETPKGDQIRSALLGLEVEVMAGVEDWQLLASSLEKASQAQRPVPPSIILRVAELVTSSPSCPRNVSFTILQKALTQLSDRRDIPLKKLAALIRSAIVHLLRTAAMAEAFEHITLALTVVQAQNGDYPVHELDWLVSTTWDEGLGFIRTSNCEQGLRWCQRAIELAKAGRSALGDELEKNLREIGERILGLKDNS